MYCSKCGSLIREDAIFCDKCGAKIVKVEDNKDTMSIANNVNATSESNTKKFEFNTNLLSILTAVLSIIATFLPFITISFFGTTFQKSYFDGDGKIIVIIAIIAIIFSFLKKKTAVIICAIINLSILIYDTFNITSFAGQNEAANEIVSSMIIKGPGYYLLYIASIGLVVAGIYNKLKVHNETISVEKVKNKLSSLTTSVSDKIKRVDLKSPKAKKVIVGCVGVVLLVVAIIFGLSLRNPGKFVKNMYGDRQYKFRDGTFAKNEWVTHNGKEYHFDSSGKMQKNAWIGVYYVDDKGEKRKNYFVNDGEDTYYLKNNGFFARNELVEINGKTYAFDDDGKNLKNKLWKNATPSYTAYVNNSGYVVKDVQGSWHNSDGQDMYIKDAKTGELIISDWSKDEQTGKYSFYDENGIKQRDKIIVETDVDTGKYCYVYDDTTSFVTEYGIHAVKSALKKSGIDLYTTYYYVDSSGYMVKNIKKEIGGTEWTFDNEGKGTRKLWVQGQYNNSSKNYIINKKMIKGISCYNIEDDWEDAYLELCFDKSDIAFFVYDDKLKRVENNYTYINNDYTLLLSSQVNNNYKFTGTLHSKGDRIYVDNYQAITTVKNHLVTGQSFLLYLREDRNYAKTYVFWIGTFNFPQIYDDTFAIKNGWRGDSYYVNNIKVTNQWQEYNGDWYYLGSDGNIVKNKWVDNEYYVDKDGKMLKDTTTPDGYKVDKNGKYIDEEIDETRYNSKKENK